MSHPDEGAGAPPAAAIFGCAGPGLSEAERDFFRDADPLGFILFARNCHSFDQLRALTGDLRAAVGRADAPILIDQEGGRVARLKPPLGHRVPAARRIGERYERDADAGRAAAWAAGRLIAADLTALGIDVDCAPVLDLARPETTKAIGDRSWSGDPHAVGELGRAVAEGLLAGGVLPVIKHMPGHGRARVDSHEELPTVDAPASELAASDFMPFRVLSGLPLGMTAHVRYTAIDPDRPATHSPTVIADIVRGHIGFDGLLMTDDLAMRALEGTPGLRARRSLAAGCDIALHCTGRLDEMRDVAANVSPMSSAACRRWAAARAAKPGQTAGYGPDYGPDGLARILPAFIGDAGAVDTILQGRADTVSDVLAGLLSSI